jgi:hypothetical protein
VSFTGELTTILSEIQAKKTLLCLFASKKIDLLPGFQLIMDEAEGCGKKVFQQINNRLIRDTIT